MEIGLFMILVCEDNFSKYRVELIYSRLNGGFCLINKYLALERSSSKFLILV